MDMIENASEISQGKFQWKKLKQPDDQDAKGLLERFPKLHPVLAKMLLARGLSSTDEIKSFFSTDLDAMVAASRMKDLEEASQRLAKAIHNHQRIRLYGDYDVDGTTSVAMMSLFLDLFDANYDFYIPDRYKEGYGVSDLGVEDAINNEVELLITLDCGINAISQVQKLKENGTAVIICDHHQPGEQLPLATAIVNHKREDCPNEEQILCGCGVALMLILETLNILGHDIDLDPFYELAAIATCSDIVPIKGSNRAIVARGLEIISKNPSPGVAQLLRRGGFKGGAVSVTDIVFKIAPRINAAGRMEHARLGVELLRCTDAGAAEALADRIEKLNVARKERDVIITQEAHEVMLKEDPDLHKSTTVVAKKDWHKGLIGIVASRLMETAYRPTIVLTEVDGVLTGSARSTPDFNLHEALGECREYLIKFGGHAAAAGLSLAPENLDAFKAAFEEVAKTRLGSEKKLPQLDIALSVDLNDWHNEGYQDFYNQLNRFRPFGPENLQPVFSTKKCIAKHVKVVGGSHLKFSVFQENHSSGIPVIAFGFGDLFDHLIKGTSFEMAYTIDENQWNGMRSIQLVAKDFKISHS
jgi:single-stranded-DNA-specific exonuclease